ncbi:winged helix DNA-binding protein [Epibacterium sp. MM17-32]|uniref:MarR family winged helix-turn-helix transcriptional regulator n=1 Tax=Epibacterium sp. MM17-32 TaxID=2917734 RepID=UPI001EF62A2D|nr:winged helix DNA-binding protein [Epibacterium sp. MM17-32]MCG7628406.1 winged helix DNA-binding protein [Epibacterium sp. MM17-32]
MSKQSLMKLMRVASHLKKYDLEMNMTRLQVLLHVSRKGSEGALVKEIVTATGHTQSTVARTLAHMGKKAVRGQAGSLDWIETRPDDDDPRRVRCILTPKGRTVIAELEDLME